MRQPDTTLSASLLFQTLARGHFRLCGSYSCSRQCHAALLSIRQAPRRSKEDPAGRKRQGTLQGGGLWEVRTALNPASFIICALRRSALSNAAAPRMPLS